MSTLYAGPAKLYRGGVALFPEGENGPAAFTIDQEALPIAAGMHGHVRSQQGGVSGKITITPFDNWANTAVVYPAIYGAKHGAAAAALAIGTRVLSGAALVPATLWVPGDARSYVAVNTAITKAPDLHLGVGKALFGPMELMALGDPAKKLGTAGFLYTITESGAADPGGLFTMADCIREEWTGTYGTAVPGFTNMETEEEWVVSVELKVQIHPVQHMPRIGVLTSVRYMVKGRLVGPTHTQIDGAIGIHSTLALGQGLGTAGTDLVLTSVSGKTITLKSCAAVGTGFEFGGSKLGTGETGFVNTMTLQNGVADALIEFSA